MNLHATARPVKFLIASALFAGTLAAMAAVPSSPAPRPPLASGVYDWNALTVQPTKIGARRDVFDAPTVTLANLECHITTVNPGEAPHASHRHADEEMLFIKEGTVEVTINGVARQAGPGSVVFFASDDLHGLRNTGSTPATYFVLRFVPHDLNRPPKNP
jgi:mannose-6-phosphate isomerase-like protein (cupin superfamily)